jgi:hypothetical protein
MAIPKSSKLQQEEAAEQTNKQSGPSVGPGPNMPTEYNTEPIKIREVRCCNDNIAILVTYTSGAGESSFGIIADSSSMTIRNSRIKVSGSGTAAPRAAIKAKKGSVVNMFYMTVIVLSGTGMPADSPFHVIDTRCKITFGYSQFYAQGAFNSGGVTPIAKYYFNMSTTDPDNDFSNIIPVPNNTYENDFYLQ